MADIRGTEAERKIIERDDAVLQRLMTFRLPYDSQRDELYRHFVGRPVPRLYPDKKTKRASVFVPYPYANVKQVRASVMEAFFGIDPPFETLPRGMRDSDAALKMQKVLEKMLAEAKLRQVFGEFIGGLCVYGFGGLKVEWDWDCDPLPEMQTVVMTDPMTGEPLIHPLTLEPQLGRQMVVKKQHRMRPKFTAIDIYDLLVDPDRAFVAHLYNKTFPQLRREQEYNPGLYNDAALAELELHLLQKPEKERDHMTIRIAELWDAVNGTFTLFTCQEDITALSYKDARYANRSASYSPYTRLTAEAPKVLLAHGPNPYLHKKVPILYANYSKLPGEVFGMGVVEPTYNLVEYLNTFLSMVVDKWDGGINSRLAYDNTRVLDLGELQMANVPNGLVGVEGPPANLLWPIPNFTPAPGDYNIIPLFQQMIETGSGVSDFYNRGVGGSQGNKTATGIQSVIQQSSKHLVELVQSLEETWQDILGMSASMVQQYITDDIEIRITDEPPGIPKLNSMGLTQEMIPRFLRISPEELAGTFDFRIVGPAYMENRFVQQNNIRMLTELIAASPGMAMYIKTLPALQEIMRVHRIPYPGRFLKTEEEVQMEQMQLMMQQIALAEHQAGLDAKVKESSKADGGKKSSGGDGKGPTVDPTTGATRAFAQQNGQNAALGGTPLGGMVGSTL